MLRRTLGSVARNLMLVAALLAVGAGSSRAFDLDELHWRRDGGNVLRVAELSSCMREQFVSFAASYRTAQVITYEQHLTADRAIETYARLRVILGAIGDRWSDAVSGDRPIPAALADDRLPGAVLYAAAAAVTLENALCLVECFGGTLWERRLDCGTSRGAEADLFHDAATRLATREYQQRLARALALLRQYDQKVASLRDDATAGRLLGVIDSAEGREQAAGAGPGALLGLTLEHRSNQLVRSLRAFALGRIGKVAMRIQGDPYASVAADDGRTTGSAATSGKLYPRRAAIEAELFDTLQPGDILLVKQKGTLLDKLIPGYYSHVGVWLGRYEELASFGTFERGANRLSYQQALDFRDRLAEGRTLLEAAPVGVICSPLEALLSCNDTVVVLRLKGTAALGAVERRALYAGIAARALYHVGKLYDFTFDVNTSDSLVCSELVYACYPADLPWVAVRRFLGGAMVSPDYVAFEAGPLPEQLLEVVYLNDEGAAVSGPETWRTYWKALKGTTETDVPTGESPAEEQLRRIIRRVTP